MDGPVRTFEEAPPIAYTRRERFVPRWWRFRTLLKGATVGLALLMVSTCGYLFLGRNATTKVTVSDAVGQFRAQSGHASSQTAIKAVDGPSGQATAGRRAPVQAESPVTRQPTHAVAAAAPAPYLLPAEGVYTYRTTGGERISLGGAHHDYPPETTGTVTHIGGCRWRIENDVIKEHTDVRTFCSGSKDLFQEEQARWVTFYGKREGEDITFTPHQLVNDVAETAGAKATSRGSDPQGDGVQVTRTYLGRVPIDIGGTTISSVRVHLTGTSSGSSYGTFVDDLWLDPVTGLTLRWDRSVDSHSNAFGANVHYTENASFVLESLTPRT
jgi:hypothetical protein